MSERWERAVDPRPSWWQRLVLWRTARDTFGEAPNPLRIMAHAKAVFLATVLHEGVYARSRVAPLRLKVLAGQRVSSLVGCTW
ncbi:MAG: hypothetical protein J2P57_14495 [Acidimicrobiaceae bacterium]|nr:hypothetical protein [Acidimicrobiaceae bacterium]